MMIYKAPAVDVAQLCVFGAIEAFEQKGFNYILFKDKQDDEDDGESKRRVWRQF